MGATTGSYIEAFETGSGFFIIDNLNLYASQSAYIAENLFVAGTIYGNTTTASYVNPLSQSVLISGSLIVNGAISASVLNVSIITSSVTTYTGSTIFGSSSSDTHQFTGSILTTGSIYVTGSVYVSGSLFGTSSYALSALSSSYSVTSSYAETASYALNASGFSTTGSFTGSFTGSVLSTNIRVTDGSYTAQNYITQSSVLNSTTGLIYQALINYHTSFIDYVAFDVNYGGTFWQAGSIILTNDGFTTGIYTSSVTPSSVPPGATLTFSGSLGGTMLLYATVAGMNTACDFILDVKSLI